MGLDCRKGRPVFATITTGRPDPRAGEQKVDGRADSEHHRRERG